LVFTALHLRFGWGSKNRVELNSSGKFRCFVECFSLSDL